MNVTTILRCVGCSRCFFFMVQTLTRALRYFVLRKGDTGDREISQEGEYKSEQGGRKAGREQLEKEQSRCDEKSKNERTKDFNATRGRSEARWGPHVQHHEPFQKEIIKYERERHGARVSDKSPSLATVSFFYQLFLVQRAKRIEIHAFLRNLGHLSAPHELCTGHAAKSFADSRLQRRVTA